MNWPEHFKQMRIEKEELSEALVALGVDEDVLPFAENHKLRMFLRTELAIRLIEPNPAALELLEANLVELQAPSWFVEERRRGSGRVCPSQSTATRTPYLRIL